MKEVDLGYNLIEYLMLQMGILRPGRLNVYPRPLHETENQRRPQLF